MATKSDFLAVVAKGSADQVAKFLQDLPKAALEGVLSNLPPLVDLVPSLSLRNCSPWAFEYIVERYVESGYNFNRKVNLSPRRRSRGGFTALLLSIECGNRPLVNALIKHNADVNITDRSGYSALHWAAFIAGGEGIFADLVNAGADLNYFINGSIPPILHIAVDEGRAEVTKLILDKGIDVNTKATYEVLSEESYGDIESRYALNSADIVTVKIQISTLGRAVRMRKWGILEMLLRYPEVELTLSDLNFCILTGDSMLANTLIRRMEEISMVDKNFFRSHHIEGVHAMHCLGGYAFSNSFQENVITDIQTKMLIQKYLDGGWKINSITIEGFDHKKISKRKRSLLFMAVQNESETIVRYLIEKGCNPCITVFGSGPYSYTALSLAVDQANVGLFKTLIESDAAFNTGKNSLGKQAIEAILSKSDDTWKMMFPSTNCWVIGPDGDIINYEAKGTTMIKILLRNGIDATGVDLSSAIFKNHEILKSPDTVKRLWWAGASLEKFDCLFDALDLCHLQWKDTRKDYEALLLWYNAVARSPLLTRLASSVIRRSTKYHGIKDLNLPKVYEDLIFNIPHRF